MAVGCRRGGRRDGFARRGPARACGCAENAAPGLFAGDGMNTSVQPEDFVLPDGAMRVDASTISDPGPFLFDAGSSMLNAVAVGQGGRQAAWFVQGEFGQGVLRHYRRGGLIARLS